MRRRGLIRGVGRLIELRELTKAWCGEYLVADE
jgi:hypothetical protein